MNYDVLMIDESDEMSVCVNPLGYAREKPSCSKLSLSLEREEQAKAKQPINNKVWVKKHKNTFVIPLFHHALVAVTAGNN